MEKRSFNCLLVLLLLFPIYVFSQNANLGFCQMSTEAAADIHERLIRNKKHLNDFGINRSVITYVPVKIHLVADDDGAGRMSVSKALDMLCLLNLEFEASDIQFYLKDDFSYIDNTLIYEHTGFSNPNGNMVVWNESTFYKATDAINIFVTNSVGGNNGASTTLAYYTPVNDCLYIQKSFAHLETVLPHTMGHFFSLKHPFIGWESQAWCEGEIDPLFCNGGAFEPETQSGSNCETTGDLICDTPPDYLFAFCPNTTNCQFNGVVFDCEGNQVIPMENNMMSFFEDCLDYEFTSGQADVMIADLYSPERVYCNPGILPTLDIFTGQVALISPNSGFEIPFNTMYFSWEPIQGATHYLLEIDRTPNFDFDPYVAIVTTNETLITNYGQPEKTYYWRIRPFNEYRTCTVYSDTGTFQTSLLSSKTIDSATINTWSIRPNPVNEKALLLIDEKVERAFDGRVIVRSVSGKIGLEKELYFDEGNFSVEIPTIDLPTGLYLISIQTNEGVTTKRVVVQ